MEFNQLQNQFEHYSAIALDWISSPEFYSQFGLIVIAIILASAFAIVLKRQPLITSEVVKDSPFYYIRRGVQHLKVLLFPLLIILFLAISINISEYLFGKSWLIRIAEGLAVVLIIYTIISRFVTNLYLSAMLEWVAIPALILQIFGWLDDVINYLESLSFAIGNIDISAYGIVRVVIFGSILFWLGRISNRVGQRLIRQQHKLDIGTREVFAKVYQVGLVVLIFILLLQVMGVNITALAVFGGALGVGLGFGLQSIASNFISGMILLLDRSLAVGDYIELEDGRKGIIRELNMRSTTLETYDGKDIMVPNEQFITTSFVNWTHKNQKQRYSLELQVAYSTDLHALFDLLREVVASHPKVLSGPNIPIEERPDAEISSFGDSGVNILIEFWMEGIDDGENRVGGDLLLMIWDALHEHNIEIPFPQREIRMLDR